MNDCGGGQALEVLIVDDCELDAELIVEALSEVFAVSYRRVETRPHLEAALAERDWDVALCDYVLDGMRPAESLRILLDGGDDLPVIGVSGVVGEEVAVEVMRAGARDFISKDRMQRLCSAVRREVDDRVARRKHREERKAAELFRTQMRRVEGMGQIAAGVAHEINTPVQFIGDNAAFLERLLRDAEPVFRSLSSLAEHARAADVSSECLQQLLDALGGSRLPRLAREMPDAVAQVRAGSERIAKIVRSMLELAHPGGGEKREVDARDLVDGAAVMTKSQWRSVAELVVDIEPQLPSLYCCPGPITQVLVN